MLNVPPTMCSSISTFCQWLLHDISGVEFPAAIVLQGDPDLINTALLEDIAVYLNEYDEEADGSWLGVSPDLLEDLHRDANMRSLLNLGELTDGDPDEAMILKRLAEHGNLIFVMPTGPVDLPEGMELFHVGIGRHQDIPGRCHMTIGPDMMATGRLPQIVADVYLEWSLGEPSDTPAARGA